MKKSINIPESLIISIASTDIEIEIFFSFEPAKPALRDPGGNFIDPPEPASVEITGIYLVSKEADILDLLLSTTEDDIKDAIFEILSDMEDSCE